MNKNATIAILTLLTAALTVPTHAQDPVLPPPVPPASPEPAATDAERVAPVPPPVSSQPKSMTDDYAIESSALDEDVTADEFDQSLKALRMELETVRTLRRERAAGTEAVSVSSALATVTQRKILLSLLQQLATRGPQKREAQATQRAQQDTPEAADDADLQLLLDSNQTIDPFALGRALFRIGEYERAEKAFLGVTPNGQNETYLKYLIATCLRKQNKTAEAQAMYQEVVLDEDADPILVESAQWQLGNMRWRENMELQLKRLREVRQGGAGPANAANGNGGAAPANGGANAPPAAPAAPGDAL